MSVALLIRRVVLALVIAACASFAPAQAQKDAPVYEPTVFQEGKDVV